MLPHLAGCSPYLVFQATSYSIAGLEAVYGQSVLRPYSAFIDAYLPDRAKPSLHRVFPPLSELEALMLCDRRRRRALSCLEACVMWERKSGLASRAVWPDTHKRQGHL